MYIPLTVQHARLVHSSIMSALAKEATHGTSLCTCACVLSMAKVSQLTCVHVWYVLYNPDCSN
jgi:hypothetical protein